MGLYLLFQKVNGKNKENLFLLLAFFFISSIKAQDLSIYSSGSFTGNGFNLPYRLLTPQDIDTSRHYPLLIFLHGAGNKGTDNSVQLNIGGRYFLRDSIRKNYPAYILFPQCPGTDAWAYFDVTFDSTGRATKIVFPFPGEPEKVTATLLQLIDSMITNPLVDKKKVYIAGLSQGAMGVLDIIARRPENFAAAISICGAGNVQTAKNFAGKTSLWLFHGEDDDVVPYSYSRDYFKRLKKLKSDVRFTSYPHIKHNSWASAFQEPDLMSWLFSKQK